MNYLLLNHAGQIKDRFQSAEQAIEAAKKQTAQWRQMGREMVFTVWFNGTKATQVWPVNRAS